MFRIVDLCHGIGPMFFKVSLVLSLSIRRVGAPGGTIVVFNNASMVLELSKYIEFGCTPQVVEVCGKW
jgi:hypothetical protein